MGRNGKVRKFYIKINNPYRIKTEEDFISFEEIYLGPLNAAQEQNPELSEKEAAELLEKGTQDIINMGYDGVIFESENGTEYVTFESSQSKLADSVLYDAEGNVIPLNQRFDNLNEDIRYSISKKTKNSVSGTAEKALFKYTEKQYNNFGWALYDGILNQYMFNDILTPQLSKLKYHNEHYNRTRSGEYIIPIGTEHGLYDVLVYVNNNPITPKISRIVRINTNNEFFREEIWRNLVSGKVESTGYLEKQIQNAAAIYGKEYIAIYNKSDSTPFQSYNERKNGERAKKGREVGRKDNQTFKRYDITRTTDTEGDGVPEGTSEGDISFL